MRDKELRLALVCYGGISLAVYMHGITKEIWHLARASRDFHDGAQVAGGSRAVYRLLIDEIAAAGEIRLRILPDIIAGASAGGINGIFLAQAVATGQSLDPLTDLWLDGADIDALLDPAAAPNSRLSKMWALPIAWYAAARDASLDTGPTDAEGRTKSAAKISRFIRSRWFEPPFGGASFDTMLLDAFAAMAKAPRGPRLLPAGQPLDLFVTVTDFRGHPERLRAQFAARSGRDRASPGPALHRPWRRVREPGGRSRTHFRRTGDVFASPARFRPSPSASSTACLPRVSNAGPAGANF